MADEPTVWYSELPPQYQNPAPLDLASVAPGLCCDSHTTPVCCDPIDCGPCCPNCPTCPSLHPGWLSWLTMDERRSLAMNCASRAHAQIDPLTLRVLDSSAMLRWAHLAAVLVPDLYRDLPVQYYRLIPTTGPTLRS